MLVGGNGAGKSTFYHQFLQPRGFPFVNADLIAKEYFPDDPLGKSREAAAIAEELRHRLLQDGQTFCFETVFSHVSKIDFLGTAKAHDYQTVLVFIHLDDPGLNAARVQQRVLGGGHDVPESKIAARILRLQENVRRVIELGLVDEVHVLDNASADNPFVRVLSIVGGHVQKHMEPLPGWAQILLPE